MQLPVDLGINTLVVIKKCMHIAFPQSNKKQLFSRSYLIS